MWVDLLLVIVWGSGVVVLEGVVLIHTDLGWLIHTSSGSLTLRTYTAQ